MSKNPPRDVLAAIIAKNMREGAAAAPDIGDGSREFLNDWADAIEQGVSLDEIRRKRLRREGKPLLRAVS